MSVGSEPAMYGVWVTMAVVQNCRLGKEWRDYTGFKRCWGTLKYWTQLQLAVRENNL